MTYKTPRGMRDILPADTPNWRRVEAALVKAVRTHGFDEIRLPLLESTELFNRGVGEATDIVEKEMYHLEDRDGGSLSLRPEGTASCARAGIQAGLLFNQIQRLWYLGPMFRYERPQKGRYRQFQQLGAEVFGVAGPEAEADLVMLASTAWRELGIDAHLTLEVNSIGSAAARRAYRAALVEFLTPRVAQLDADSQRRMLTNPLRILDSKDPSTQALLEDAPPLEAYMDAESRDHFERFQALLTELQLPFVVNPRLVRGLDYYTHTVFEWTTTMLGAQGTVCAGGRYDGLVELLGGKATPGCGFAAGIDRVALLDAAVSGVPARSSTDVYVAVMESRHAAWAMTQASALRGTIPGLRVLVDTAGGKLKSQLKRADASGAAWALIVGEDEVSNNRVTAKRLDSGEQETIDMEALAARLASNLE